MRRTKNFGLEIFFFLSLIMFVTFLNLIQSYILLSLLLYNNNNKWTVIKKSKSLISQSQSFSPLVFSSVRSIFSFSSDHPLTLSRLFQIIITTLALALTLRFMADSQAKSSGMSPGVGGGGSHESGGDQSPRSMNVREQDRFLPIANISRIMKRGLPANGKIAKDAKETMQECVSEFISFVTSEASDKCQREKRKTINGDDLLWAMTTLGFEEYVEPLKFYLTRYREGDNKGSGKGGESSGKRDGQPGQVISPFLQQGQQGSFSQGPYGNSQGSHMMVQMPNAE
uniref:Transcription factor CBF/NF-Y/archaeal histone domain-containing protein n=1 Tax=Brassica oleracea TaxID=3712 RepID=A0A3P6GEC3_BRAOL|nr:unnamed protein product [Brassica oleracea]